MKMRFTSTFLMMNEINFRFNQQFAKHLLFSLKTDLNF